MRGRRLDVVAAVFCAWLGGCSLVVNTDGLSGGAPQDGGSRGDEDANVPDAAGTDADAGADGADSGAADADSDAADAPPADSGFDATPDARTADSGVRDAGTDAAACKTDLSNIGLADFTIAMTVTTVQTGLVATANQRNVCNLAPLWDVRLSNGNLYIETCDGPHYSMLTTAGALANDGQPHAIVVKRRSQALTAYVDGKSVGTTTSTSSFGQLPPLEMGVDPCDTHPGNAALVGTLTGLCLTSP
jgi:hypothetical protein